jgi:hypothetical protein
LGYPISDEMNAAEPGSRISQFQDGSICWSAQTGPQEVVGAFHKHWLELGGQKSYLGLPVKTLHSNVIRFRRGSIHANDANVFDVTDARTVNTGTIHVDGAAANGWSELTITSKGNYTYHGSIRSTGALSYDVLMTTMFDVKDANGKFIVFAQKGDVEGTLVLGGNRAHTWDESGVDERIRDNWDALSNAKASSYLKVDFGPGDVAALVATVVGVPLAIIGIVVGSIFAADNTDVCGVPEHEEYDWGRGEYVRSKGVTFVCKGCPCPPGTIPMR